MTTYTVLGDEPLRLTEILDKARAGVPAEALENTLVLHGSAARNWRRSRKRLDLLICGSRGYGPVRSLLLGGVTSELAHTARCPLLVVPRALATLLPGC